MARMSDSNRGNQNNWSHYSRRGMYFGPHRPRTHAPRSSDPPGMVSSRAQGLATNNQRNSPSANSRLLRATAPVFMPKDLESESSINVSDTRGEDAVFDRALRLMNESRPAVDLSSDQLFCFQGIDKMDKIYPDYKELTAWSDVDSIASEIGEHDNNEFFPPRKVKTEAQKVPNKLQLGPVNTTTPRPSIHRVPYIWGPNQGPPSWGSEAAYQKPSTQKIREGPVAPEPLTRQNNRHAPMVQERYPQHFLLGEPSHTPPPQVQFYQLPPVQSLSLPSPPSIQIPPQPSMQYPLPALYVQENHFQYQFAHYYQEQRLQQCGPPMLRR